ncbi:MAG: serine/threonine protein kinase [Alphaproteobacteria bacterium]|nr:serine/threonine protein kinase [Alphaproteobacteria bacterium]
MSQDALIGADLGGRFRVERFVTDAMLGRVYAARGLHDGKLYHVKVPHASVSGNKEKTERFRRELQATGLIDSPHTVKVVDTGIHGDSGFLVMEYLAATPLQEVIDKGALDPERAASIAAQVAMGIAAAHQVGVVHRNLSPQTVLLLDNAADGGDFVKVSDFGLSRFFDDDATEAMVVTQAGTRIGNVLYMAPEYIEYDEVHPNGDVYALGVLIYNMLTGQPPFTGKAGDVLSAHVTAEIPRPSMARRGLPRWADDVVVALMAKEPADRPDPAGAVALLEAAVGHPLRASRLLGVDEEGAVIRPSRMPYYVAGAGAVLMALGAMFFVGTGVVAGGVWAWYNLPAMILPQSGDLAPLPDATLPTRTVPGDPVPPSPTPGPTPGPRPSTPRPTPPAPTSPGTPSPAPVAAPAPAPAEVATLRIRSTQRAVVWVDDKVAGYTPIDQGVEPGAHKVVAMLPGKPETRQQHDVQASSGAPTMVELSF